MLPFSVSRKSEYILHQSCLMMTECVYACLRQELIKEFYTFSIFLKRKMIESNRVICGLCSKIIETQIELFLIASIHIYISYSIYPRDFRRRKLNCKKKENKRDIYVKERK